MKEINWLKKEINKLNEEVSENFPHEQMIEKGKVMDLIDQLEQPEKPVIPKIVADWIEKWKNEDFTIGEWFEFFSDNDKHDAAVEEWLYSNDYAENKRREYLLVDAIRYGYEVEKEKLYTACFETKECLIPRGLFLYKSKGRIYVGDNIEEFHEGNERCQLTEKEIKGYDERFWQFAEEVQP